MPLLSRRARLLVVASCVVSFWGASVACGFQNYPPQSASGWSDSPAAAAESRSSWPRNEATSNPPRTLPTQYAAPIPARTNGSTLAQPAAAETTPRPIPKPRTAENAPAPLAGWSGGQRTPLVNAATSLAIVLGLFLLVAWAVRRGMPKGSGLLPTEAVEVLGRASLAGRQQVHLVRCGNKLVLVSVTPSGTQPLAEISDPAEVDRLHSICQPHGASTGPVRRFFGMFTGATHSADYYVRDEADRLDFRHLETGGHRRA